MTETDMRGISTAAVIARKKWQVSKKASTRRYIRECALKLFAEYGYDEVTVKQIADKAGVTPITLFRYFPQKEDIILRLPRDIQAWDLFAAQLLDAANTEAEPIAFFSRAITGLTDMATIEDVGTIVQRLHLILENETLLHALYAKIPTWSSTLRHAVFEQPESLNAILSSTSMVELAIELMLEWARRTESSSKPDKAVFLQVLDEVTTCSSRIPTRLQGSLSVEQVAHLFSDKDEGSETNREKSAQQTSPPVKLI
ncbi:TetR family transcriptional regulator [Bifidobacterium sp. B4001]|uniref:TetR/AcrR family transcriptional regulator n=2 Tax=unclassified Bifidobacterium TaxID=2608897 RepID=UPI00226B76EB|nr:MULTISPECIES: TetR/AcrR family transcriptional regulator [unclassified Bifidobacterium]MCX8672377.1 TetR family transcriptional regulator [Bifidobacterium sp. B4079]MCX8680811.1 TetR family transcriptional regulator [Bifidobacterium sp. B4001]